MNREMEYKVITWAEINLDNIAHNVRNTKACGKANRNNGVVKADAYGHGVLETVSTLIENGTLPAYLCLMKPYNERSE